MMNENKWLPHLIEIRGRLIKVLLAFAIVFLVCFFYANSLFNYFASPILKLVSGKLLATHVASPLFVPITLAMHVSLFITAPFLLYQIWAFITPALYQKEKLNLPFFFLLSVILFYLGVFFCFYIVLPFMFSFFQQATPAFVQFAPDIASFLNFSMSLMLSFGACFEVPIIVLCVLKINLVTIASLKNFRPYLIVAAFTIGMLLTPPDVMSQVMLALPICLLYEAGIILGKFCIKKENKEILLSP